MRDRISEMRSKMPRLRVKHRTPRGLCCDWLMGGGGVQCWQVAVVAVVAAAVVAVRVVAVGVGAVAVVVAGSASGAQV